jgi:uncharacterized protein with PQ loop repeat
VVAELLGWFGAGLSCVISLPQVVRTIRAKRLDGISSATYWLVLANAATWTAWSLLTGEYAAGVPALVNGPVAIVILHRLVVTRQTARRSEFVNEVRESPPIRFTDVAAAIGYRSHRSGHASLTGRERERQAHPGGWVGKPSRASGARSCPAEDSPNSVGVGYRLAHWELGASCRTDMDQAAARGASSSSGIE